MVAIDKKEVKRRTSVLLYQDEDIVFLTFKHPTADIERDAFGSDGDDADRALVKSSNYRGVVLKNLELTVDAGQLKQRSLAIEKGAVGFGDFDLHNFWREN